MKLLLATLIVSMVFIAGCTNIPHVDPIRRGPDIKDAEQCEGGKTATCPDGTKYDVWNVVDGKCVQINYIRDPCGELPDAGRVMQITQEICESAGGNWNECGSVCTGYGPDCIGIAVCNPQCECGGVDEYTCPAGYKCRLSGKIADEIGVCVPKENV